jgi:hypothetical protein
MDKLRVDIEKLAEKYSTELKERMDNRSKEMKADDNSHYLIYQVLGISSEEGRLIDSYQNKGRFLYKYAGSFVEDAVKICFKFKFPDAERIIVPNTIGSRPKTFEIDCLVHKNAFEIKWRDATTDGDHITKEHTKIKVVQLHGYKPIRIMFYRPNREQAIRIQDTIKTLYQGVGGEYYSGDEAWDYLRDYTGVDLKKILTTIAQSKTGVKS